MYKNRGDHQYSGYKNRCVLVTSTKPVGSLSSHKSMILREDNLQLSLQLKMQKSHFMLLLLAFAFTANAREIVVINRCPQEIMVRTLGNAGKPSLGERKLGGNGQQTAFGFPNGWSGRLWANNSPGATLFEITTNGGNDLDYYNISCIDGFNFGMTVGPRGGGGAKCKWFTCLYHDCPDAYQKPDDDRRKHVVSACRDANYEVTFCP